MVTLPLLLLLALKAVIPHLASLLELLLTHQCFPAWSIAICLHNQVAMHFQVTFVPRITSCTSCHLPTMGTVTID